MNRQTPSAHPGGLPFPPERNGLRYRGYRVLFFRPVRAYFSRTSEFRSSDPSSWRHASVSSPRLAKVFPVAALAGHSKGFGWCRWIFFLFVVIREAIMGFPFFNKTFFNLAQTRHDRFCSFSSFRRQLSYPLCGR